MDLLPDNSTNSIRNATSNVKKRQSNYMTDTYDELDKSLFGAKAAGNVGYMTSKSSIAEGNEEEEEEKEEVEESKKKEQSSIRRSKVTFQDLRDDDDDGDDFLDDLLADSSRKTFPLTNEKKETNQKPYLKQKSNTKLSSEKIANLLNDVRSNREAEVGLNNNKELKSINNPKSDLSTSGFKKPKEEEPPINNINDNWGSNFAKSNLPVRSHKPEEGNKTSDSIKERFAAIPLSSAKSDKYSKSSFSLGFNSDINDNPDKSAVNSRLTSNENVNKKVINDQSYELDVDNSLLKTKTMSDLYVPSFSNTNITANTLAGPRPIITSSSSTSSIAHNESKREPRRRPKVTFDKIYDPLGLFSAEDYHFEDILPDQKDNTEVQPVEDKKPSEQSAPPEDLPEWLGGTKKSTSESEIKQSSNIATKSRENMVKDGEGGAKATVDGIKHKDAPIPSNTTLEIDQESSLKEPFVIMQQQQDQELKDVTMLTQQTDQLINYIVENQQSKLNEQDKLFDTLIKRQIGRQAMLESQIQMQQARINRYIQTLARQSISMTQSSAGPQTENIDESSMDNILKRDSQCSLQTVQAEKENLEYMQDILRAKHEREIDILKNSHETQMNFMQESMEKLETRLRREMDDLQMNYETKIEKILHEKNQQELEFKEQIENLKSSQMHVIKDIYARHSENISLLQKEHLEMIENMTKAKELERETVDFIKSQRTDINKMLEKSEHLSVDFQTLYGEIKKRDIETMNKREKSLKIREESLDVLIQQVHHQQEALNNERKQLLTTADKLQLELNQLTSQFIKNNELLNERETRLANQEKVLVRERELFQEQCSWERQHLQSLKEAWVADQKQQMQLLTKEREYLATERGKIELVSHLKANSHDITKTELEAAIKAAYDAQHEAKHECQKWKEKTDSFYVERRQLEKRETELIQKARELEDLTQAALVKREEGMRALREAQRLEKQHKDQLNQLQTQLQLITERETRVVAEKLSLAKERLALKLVNHRIEGLPEKEIDDSLYSTDKQIFNESRYISSAHQQMHFTDVVDPQLLLLRINLDNKLNIPHPMIANMPIIE